jgi:hypothetical protein
MRYARWLAMSAPPMRVGGVAGLIPGPAYESVFAMETQERPFTLLLQQPEVGLPVMCGAVSEKSPFS